MQADDDDEDDAPAEAKEDHDPDDFDMRGLPTHLDVNPSDLFWQPDDKVVDAADDFVGLDTQFDDFGQDFDVDLADQPTIVGQDHIGYSRNAKFVDVKLVKRLMWNCLSADIDTAQESNTEMACGFQDLVTRTMDAMPTAESENLSAQVCFICALHLCNEKNLEIEAGGHLGDFELVAPET